MTDHQRLPLTRKLAYALPALALAIVGIPVYVFIPKFYTDVVGVNIILVGYLLFGVRLFDAVTDPVIGYISDNTRSRFGRRRPYMAAGSLCLALLLFLLFTPPAGATHKIASAWFGVMLFLLFLFWTIVVVPYESLGPEISYDYHERTVLFSWRDGFLILGTLIAAASPGIITGLIGLTDDDAGQRRKFFWIAAVYAPLVIACCWICVAAVKERRDLPPIQREGAIGEWLSVFRNRPFVILLISYTIAAVGSNLPATLILYYVEYVLQTTGAELFLALYFVTGIVFLPPWIALSRRIEKKWAWLAAMAVNTGAFLGVFFLGPGDAGWYGLLVVLSGIGFGAGLALPSAIQADVIDYDEMMTGQRREGRYIGIWSIAKKIAAALGIGIGLAVLGKAGYTPGQPQNDTVVLTLRILYALVPCLCNLVALVVLLPFPISKAMHDDIRKAIATAGTKGRNP
jgi:GPH family glycoside/pentoside/hexuronide:cation symporter